MVPAGLPLRNLSAQAKSRSMAEPSPLGKAIAARRHGIPALARRQIFVHRLVAHLRQQIVAFAGFDQLRDIGLGIAEIAEMAGAGRAGFHAGRRAVFGFKIGRCKCGRRRACISS